MSILGWLAILGNLARPFVIILLVAGFMVLCHDIERGERFSVGHLFAELRSHLRALLILGALYTVAVVAVALTTAAGAFGSAQALLVHGSDLPGRPGLLIGALLLFVLMTPVVMATWSAPALIVLDGLTAIDAINRSFSGCMRNIGPFLVYGTVTLCGLALVATPFLLGLPGPLAAIALLIVVPVLCGSAYASYQDIHLVRRD